MHKYLKTRDPSISVWQLEGFLALIAMDVVMDIEAIKKFVHHLDKAGCLSHLILSGQQRSLANRFTKHLWTSNHIIMYVILIMYVNNSCR